MGNGVPQSAGNGGRGDEIGAAVKDESGNGDPLGQYMPTEKVPPSARGQIMDVPANQQVDRSSGRHRHAFGKPVLDATKSCAAWPSGSSRASFWNFSDACIGLTIAKSV